MYSIIAATMYKHVTYRLYLCINQPGSSGGGDDRGGVIGHGVRVCMCLAKIK